MHIYFGVKRFFVSHLTRTLLLCANISGGSGPSPKGGGGGGGGGGLTMNVEFCGDNSGR